MKFNTKLQFFIRHIKSTIFFGLSALLLVSTLSCASSSSLYNKETTKVTINSKSDSSVNGVIQITEKAPGLLTFNVDVDGLTPNSTHGIHIHEKGDCSAPDAKSAGGHYNPANKDHGGPKKINSHAGDLGNLKANSKGQAKTTFVQAGLALNHQTNSKSIYSINGRALIIHENRDDLTTNPSGAAGKRIACGVITSN